MPAETLRDGSRRPEDRFRSVLAATAPAVAEAIAGAEPSGRLRIFGGIRGFLRQASGPGWALVGDAGYFKDPVTAHGITDAFRDAELLARAVASGTDRALEDYQHLRDAMSLQLFRVTEAVAALDWSLDELKVQLAGLNEAMQIETRLLGGIVARTPLPPLGAGRGASDLAMAV
jgi:flavin-dependent dehydrogenase